MPNTRSSGRARGGGGGKGGEVRDSRESSSHGRHGFADARGERSTDGTAGSRPRNIETRIPSHIRRVLREGTHYLYLHSQLCEIESGVSADDVIFVDDGDIPMETPRSAQTPGTSAEESKVIIGAAAKAWGRRGQAAAWETLLRPLTRSNPLPVEVCDYLFKHFSASHKPSKLTRFHGIEIKDHEKHRNTTSCFVCAALCDQVIRTQAQSTRVLRSHTPTTRYFPVMSGDMTNFLHGTPVLGQLLGVVEEACRTKNSDTLREILITPVQADGNSVKEAFLDSLQRELQQTCPKGNEGLLDTALRNISTAGWVSIVPVVFEYLKFIRDWSWPTNQAEEIQLQKLIDYAIIALGDTTYGSLILPTVLDLSRFLALVVCKSSPSAATLAQITASSGGSHASTRPAKFLEECANSLREAFIRCLVGGSSGSGAHGTAPDGKRQGIYITSNSCLRLLFRCGKLRNAQQMFVSIDAQSPYLDFYPRAQRVTYLYYLGAYHFANNHFYRSQIALQAAYNLCHRQDLPHRRQILTYLIAANICLGRFPSQILLSRPEAADLAPHFYPLCKVIAQGDLGTFHAHLDLRSDTSHWFLRKRILLQLRNRGEVLVWRALIQKTFRYAGHQPAGDRMVPFLRLPFVQAAAQFSLERATAPSNRTLTKQGTFSFVVTQQPTPPAEEDYTDPDLDGVDAAVNDTGFDVESGSYDDAQIGLHQHSLLTPPHREASPTMAEVESIFASLIQQGFLRGFLTHGEKPRFAVPGSGPHGGALVHGFPNIWRVIRGREDDKVPGWVRKEDVPQGGLFVAQSGFAGGGGGRVVNLSGARPAGAGP